MEETEAILVLLLGGISGVSSSLEGYLDFYRACFDGIIPRMDVVFANISYQRQIKTCRVTASRNRVPKSEVNF